MGGPPGSHAGGGPAGLGPPPPRRGAAEKGGGHGGGRPLPLRRRPRAAPGGEVWQPSASGAGPGGGAGPADRRRRLQRRRRANPAHGPRSAPAAVGRGLARLPLGRRRAGLVRLAAPPPGGGHTPPLPTAWRHPAITTTVVLMGRQTLPTFRRRCGSVSGVVSLHSAASCVNLVEFFAGASH